MNKFTVVAITVIILCFGGLILWSANNRRDSKINLDDYDASKIIEASDNNGNIGDHVRGKIDSGVIVVEYADMSCPGCAQMMSRMTTLYENYGDKVAFVFRHFPLKDHQNSRSASAAIESAGYQNYYWEMLEALYENRSDWLYATGQERTDIYAKIFKEIAPEGNEEQFRIDMNDAKIEKKISFDYNLGKEKSKVDATPSIFVNGEKVEIENDGTFDDIVKNIESLINKHLEEAGEKEVQEKEEKASEEK